MRTLEELRQYFGGDHFAVRLGIAIEAVSEREAVCSLALDGTHLNAQGTAQGGVIFTLADFAFAVAANAVSPGTVTLNAGIQYLAPGTGARLVATARPVGASGRTSVYQVTVCGEKGRLVAIMTATGFAKQHFHDSVSGQNS
jgi:acyl-CoA thioesterase